MKIVKSGEVAEHKEREARKEESCIEGVKNTLKIKIQELKTKKWTFFAMKFWSIFWISLMFAVFVYFTTLIFIDYFTIYLGGEALGGLSRSQALVIWIYYMFAIVVGSIVSVIYSFLHEIMPKKLRNPFQLSTRIKVFYISQFVSVFTAIIYYSILKLQIPIAEIDIGLFFLYLPSIFLSGKTILLTLIFVGLPAVVSHLVFYPIKSGVNATLAKLKSRRDYKNGGQP